MQLLGYKTHQALSQKIWPKMYLHCLATWDLWGQDMALQVCRRMKAMLASVPGEALPRKSCGELASEVVKFSCPEHWPKVTMEAHQV